MYITILLRDFLSLSSIHPSRCIKYTHASSNFFNDIHPSCDIQKQTQKKTHRKAFVYGSSLWCNNNNRKIYKIHQTVLFYTHFVFIHEKYEKVSSSRSLWKSCRHKEYEIYLCVKESLFWILAARRCYYKVILCQVKNL